MICILLSNIRANFVLLSPLALLRFWYSAIHIKKDATFFGPKRCNRFFEVESAKVL
jgi:hypothetical protein